MSGYISPFRITNEILSYVFSISEKIGEISATSNLESKLHLRRNNRIKFIHPFSDGNGRMADCGTQLFYRNGNRYLNIFQLIVKLEVKIWHTVSW